MQFTVTYRSRSGTVETEVFDSASRAELFRQLQGRGISPIKVAEGAQGVKPKSGGSTAKDDVRRSVSTRYWIMVAMALAVGVCVWFCVGPAKPRTLNVPYAPSNPVPKKVLGNPNDTTYTRQDVQGTSATNVHSTVADSVDSVVVTNDVISGTDRHRGKRVVSRTFETNKFKLVEWIVTEDGRRYKVMRDPPGSFKTGTDQILAMALANMEDGRTAPMPGLSEKELQRGFKESLSVPIEILDSDSDKVRALKMAVKEAREEMAMLVENGGNATEALQEHLKLKEENAKVRRQCLAEYRELLKSGKSEDAANYLRTVNIALQQMGIAALPESGRDRMRPLRGAANAGALNH